MKHVENELLAKGLYPLGQDRFEFVKRCLHRDIDKAVEYQDFILDCKINDWKYKYRIGQMEAFNTQTDWRPFTQESLRYMVSQIAGYPMKDLFIENRGGNLIIKPIFTTENWNFRFEIAHDIIWALDRYGLIGIIYKVKCLEVTPKEFTKSWESTFVLNYLQRISEAFADFAKAGISVVKAAQNLEENMSKLNSVTNKSQH